MRLAILAGAGKLPIIAGLKALESGELVKIYTIAEKSSFPEELTKFTQSIVLSQVGNSIKKIKADQISHILLIGKFSKDVLFKKKFDLKALSLLKKIKNQNDGTLFRVLLEEFEAIGIKVISQRTYFESLTMKAGVYSKKKPNLKLKNDIDYGFEFAQKIASLDIGQTVIVKNRTLIAVEAIEGTNAAILRAGELTQGKGGVVCKAERTNQDERFDIPTVGLETLEAMQKSGMEALAIQAEKTFVVTPEKIVARANELGLIFLAMD